MTDVEERWYWDQRTNKAYYPVEGEDGRVVVLSAWHEEEVEGALDSGQWIPVEEVSGENIGFDHFESFRLLEEDELDRFRGADDE